MNMNCEIEGDTLTLGGLLEDDFRGIDPHGFVLNKQQWLARYDSQDLATETLRLRDIEEHRYGSFTVAIAIQEQRAAYRGSVNEGAFRTSFVLSREGVQCDRSSFG